MLELRFFEPEREAVLRAVARPPLAPAFLTDGERLRADVSFRAPEALRELVVFRRAVVVFLRAALVFLRPRVVFRRAVDVFFRAPVVLRRVAVVFFRALDV